MAEPLKNIYNKEFFNSFSSTISTVFASFDREKFLQLIYDEQWERRELKNRMRHITLCLHQTLALDYRSSIELLSKITPQCKGFPFLFFPDFVEVYGMEHLSTSIQAMELFTQFSSAEFAVRPFIIKYPGEMMVQLERWTSHENHHVRRLACEGCRPRLPWAMALPMFKNDPSPIIPILEKLKNDSSDYVRRSVANNLNDITKDHPKLVLQLIRSWKVISPQTDWIIKHACRTLLKRGNQEALALFDFSEHVHVKILNLHLSKESISIGESINFSFTLVLQGALPTKLRIEYGVYFVKANKRLSRKIFQLTEKEFTPGEEIRFMKKQSFKDLTTRKHYPGNHKISIVINGKEVAQVSLIVV